jgi:hypothetical protein
MQIAHMDNAQYDPTLSRASDASTLDAQQPSPRRTLARARFVDSAPHDPQRPFGQFPFQAVARRVQTQYFRRIFGNVAARRDRTDGGVIDV